MAEEVEIIAGRVARLALQEIPHFGRIGPGSVLSVVRDPTTGRIFIGLNTGTPQQLVDALRASIQAQGSRIANGEVKVVRTDPMAMAGGHAEVNALNSAIRAKEQQLGRTLTEADLRVFEMHNVWLNGPRAGSPAPRCEHCSRIVRGVTITRSLFVAEGGRLGEIDAPRVPQRGMVTRGNGPTLRGGGMGGTVVLGLLSIGLDFAELWLKQWIADNIVAEKAKEDITRMIQEAMVANSWRFRVLIATRSEDLRKAQATGSPVVLHVVVITKWIDTDYGPAPFDAWVHYYSLVFEGETPVDLPIFQKRNFVKPFFSLRSKVLDIPLVGTTPIR